MSRASLIVCLLLSTLRAQGTSFADDVAPFLERHCTSCHGGSDPRGGLDLLEFAGGHDTDALAIWMGIRDRLRTGEMPPPGRRRPPRNDMQRIAELADRELGNGLETVSFDPGRVTVRRLSRVEYENTVLELLGVASPLTAEFPADDLGYGFDNIGDALSFSLLHLEKYAAAAEDIARQAVSLEEPGEPRVRRIEAELMESSMRDGGGGGDVAALYTNGDVRGELTLPRDGNYILRAGVYATRAGKDLAQMEIRVDESTVAAREVEGTRRKPETHEVAARLKGGRRTVSVAFVNDFYEPKNPDKNRRDRNLYVDWVEVVGPVDAVDPPWAHRWIFAPDPGTRAAPELRAKRLLGPLISKAWRRPATKEQIARLGRLVTESVDEGASLAEGMRRALEAILVSPSFLFRLEPRSEPDRTGVVALDAHALATRLSYFIWSRPPDDTLRRLADRGELRDAIALRKEARRLLRDARASALATNFAAQWLELRNLEDAQPDPDRFPAFTDTLRVAMRQETEMLFEAVLRERRSVFELLDPGFTFLNGELAKHYGISGVQGTPLRRVRLQDPRRGGLLCQASIHVVTSNPTRTSPVKRGKWILENLLDAPPPPPPPGIGALGERKVETAASFRERMEAHRSNPSCASCHARMDALGFALENFDAVGRWRQGERGVPVDARGELPGGAVLSGPLDLRKALVGDRTFVKCLAKKLFVYALGRDAGPSDQLALEALVRAIPAEPTLEDLVLGIVGQDAFRFVRVGEQEK